MFNVRKVYLFVIFILCPMVLAYPQNENKISTPNQVSVSYTKLSLESGGQFQSYLNGLSLSVENFSKIIGPNFDGYTGLGVNLGLLWGDKLITVPASLAVLIFPLKNSNLLKIKAGLGAGLGTHGVSLSTLLGGSLNIPLGKSFLVISYNDINGLNIGGSFTYSSDNDRYNVDRLDSPNNFLARGWSIGLSL